MSGQDKTPKVAKSSGRGSKPGERRGGRVKGVPNKATAEIREIAREYTAVAIKALADVVQNSESDAARVSAANAILDRAYGRPSQSVAISGADGGPVRHAHELTDEALAKIAAGGL